MSWWGWMLLGAWSLGFPLGVVIGGWVGSRLAREKLAKAFDDGQSVAVDRLTLQVRGRGVRREIPPQMPDVG